MANCPKCGAEEVATCPDCGQRVDVYSRVVGYLRPIHTWNEGKVQEFKDRVEYDVWGPDPIWYHKYKSNYTDKANESITLSK